MSTTELLFDIHGGCALGGIPSSINPKSKHHIEGKEFGGQDVWTNYVPLCRYQHDMLEILKFINKKTGEYELLLRELKVYFYDYIQGQRHEERDIWGLVVYQEVMGQGYIDSHTKRGIKMLVKNRRKVR